VREPIRRGPYSSPAKNSRAATETVSCAFIHSYMHIYRHACINTKIKIRIRICKYTYTHIHIDTLIHRYKYKRTRNIEMPQGGVGHEGLRQRTCSKRANLIFFQFQSLCACVCVSGCHFQCLCMVNLMSVHVYAYRVCRSMCIYYACIHTLVYMIIYLVYVRMYVMYGVCIHT
jgi:hypothetical protein